MLYKRQMAEDESALQETASSGEAASQPGLAAEVGTTRKGALRRKTQAAAAGKRKLAWDPIFGSPVKPAEIHFGRVVTASMGDIKVASKKFVPVFFRFGPGTGLPPAETTAVQHATAGGKGKARRSWAEQLEFPLAEEWEPWGVSEKSGGHLPGCLGCTAVHFAPGGVYTAWPCSDSFGCGRWLRLATAVRV